MIGANKVLRALSHMPHGRLYHMVLTQMVHFGESVRDCAARMHKKWRAYHQWLVRRGMNAGFLVAHCTMSRLGGWHFHLHLLLEFHPAVPDEWQTKWCSLLTEEQGVEIVHSSFCRQVCDFGAAFEGNVGVQGELWEEAPDAVTAMLQYLLRDASQGIERWDLDACTDASLADFVEHAKGMKWWRLYGHWRLRSPPTERELAHTDRAMAARTGAFGWLTVGTVDRARALARAKEGLPRLAFIVLQDLAKWRGPLAERLRFFVSSALE